MVSEKVYRVLKFVHYQAFYFIFYGGYIPFLLYFPIYLKHIGLNAAQVGVIGGVRPIFQSIATPLLVLVGDRLRSRKLLFVISSLIGIVKLICLFLLLKPSYQHCVVTTVEFANKTRIVVSEHRYVIQHRLNKRDVTDQWSPNGKNQDEYILTEHFEQNDVENRSYYPNVKGKNGKSVKGGSAGIDRRNNESVNAEKINTLLHPLNATQSENSTSKGNSVRKEYRIINDEEVRRLFYSLLVVAVVTDLFDGAVFMLVDHASLENHRQDYGFSRLWGTLGWGLMAPTIAIVLHSAPHELCGYMVDTYHYVFIFAIVFFNLALLLGSHLDLRADFQEMTVNEVQGTKSNFHYGVFLIVFAYAGFCDGFLFTFVNWFIDSLGGGAGIMGVAVGCRCVVDLGLFFLLRKMTDRIGNVPVISLGLVGHVAVFFMFSRATNAWMVVCIEVVHALFYGFLASTCSVFLHQSVPTGSNIRLQGNLYLFAIKCDDRLQSGERQNIDR